jgi:hypothetical protein
LKAIQEQRKDYEYWLMERHFDTDPQGDCLESLPLPVREKLQAVKRFAAQIAADKAKQTNAPRST